MKLPEQVTDGYVLVKDNKMLTESVNTLTDAGTWTYLASEAFYTTLDRISRDQAHFGGEIQKMTVIRRFEVVKGESK